MTGCKSDVKPLHWSVCSWCGSPGGPGAAFVVAAWQCGSQHRLAVLVVLVVLALTATLSAVPALTEQQTQAVEVTAILEKLTVIGVES